jgi:LytR cell envelope-related transcriptional attenuator
VAVDTASYPAYRPSYDDNELVGPWRRAALVAVGIALAEFVALVGILVAMVGGPILHSLEGARAAQTSTPATAAARPQPAPVHHAAAKVFATAPLAPARTRVLVLNGNGVAGAAHAEAATLLAHGYRIAATGNAARSDYATTILMYRQGFEREARRLAHTAGISVVAPLDGLPPAALHGAQLAVILGR